MARIVQLTCVHCGHTQMQVVESTENGKAVEEIAAGESSTAEEMRLRRLKSLPTSLPVGGIITPV